MNRPHLNRALTLEAPQRLDDGAGGYGVTWVPLGTLWAQIAPRSGRETKRGGAAVSRMGLRIMVRAAPPGAPDRPAPEQRFREGDRIYKILAVAESDSSGRFLICLAEEELAL